MKSISNYSRTKSFICKGCGVSSPCRYTGKNIYCSRQCAGMDMKDARREQSKRPEVREKIAKGWFAKGKSASPETQFKKGNNPWHKGKTDVYTEEQLERITEANRKKGHATAGENNWQWKGGITADTRKQRVKFGMYTRPKVMKRDNYTCQECNKYGGRLHVDHIKAWKDYPELRFDINNCRTVCVDCHYFITFGRKRPEDSTWGTHNMNKGVI